MTTYAETEGNAGLVVTRKVRSTGLLVSIYRAAAAGIEDDLAHPYAVLCEPHATLTLTQTIAESRAWVSAPEEWCPDCRGDVVDPYAPKED